MAMAQLSFAQDAAQCRSAFLQTQALHLVEGLRDDLYYACVLLASHDPDHRQRANTLLESAAFAPCPYSGLPAVQLLLEHRTDLSPLAQERLMTFLRQGQAGWLAELEKGKWNSFALLAAVSVLGYGVISGDTAGCSQARRALTALEGRMGEGRLPDEFLSPFYTALQLAALAELQCLPLDDACRKTAQHLEEFTWHGVLQHCQPGFMALTGVYSRGYTSELCGHFQAVMACVRRLLDDACWFTLRDTLWNTRYTQAIVPHGTLDGMRLYALYFSAFPYHCAPQDLADWHSRQLPRQIVQQAHTDPAWDISCKKDVDAGLRWDYPAAEVTMVTRQEADFSLSWVDREYENGMACPALRALYCKDGDTKALFTKLVRDTSRYIGEENDFPNLGLRLNASNFPDDGRKFVVETPEGLVLTYRPRGFCSGADAMKLDLLFTEHFSPVDRILVNGCQVKSLEGGSTYALGPVAVEDGDRSFTFTPRGENGFWQITRRNHFLNLEWVQPWTGPDGPVWTLLIQCGRRTR